MTTRPPMSLSYRIALSCGALPLVVGISVFVLWLVTRWDSLMPIGATVIGVGVVFFLVGITALVRFYLTPRERAIGLLRSSGASTWIAALLLLSNFPVALALVFAAMRIETAYIVEVRNESPQVLEGVRVFGGGCDVSLDAIPQGEAESRWLWIRGDGQLELQVRVEGEQQTTLIDGYVSGSHGGHNTVTVGPGGTVETDLRYR